MTTSTNGRRITTHEATVETAAVEVKTWSWMWLSGEARVILMGLTLQPPVRGGGPKQRWAGCIPWFNLMGLGLDFNAYDAAEGDDALA